jgi:hypothetical protein
MGMNAVFPVNPAKKLPLPRVDDPASPEAQRLVAAKQPFTCKVKDWPLLDWSIPYLKSKVGHVPREMVRTKTKEKFGITTAEFLEMIERDPGWKSQCMPAEGGGPPMDLRKPEYSTLFEDLRLPSYVTAGQYTAHVMIRNSRDTGRGEFYDTPAHYELNVTPSIYIQVLGKKHLWLFSPDEARRLGMESFMTEPPYLSNGAEACSNQAKYPELAEATCYEIVLERGDLVFWPEFWVHWFAHHHDFQLNIRLDWLEERFQLNPMSATWVYCNALAESLGGFGNFKRAFMALPPEAQALLVKVEQTLFNEPRVFDPRTMTIERFKAGFPSDQTAYSAPAPTSGAPASPTSSSGPADPSATNR